jgi:hypothetical protein
MKYGASGATMEKLFIVPPYSKSLIYKYLSTFIDQVEELSHIIIYGNKKTK